MRKNLLKELESISLGMRETKVEFIYFGIVLVF